MLSHLEGIAMTRTALLKQIWEAPFSPCIPLVLLWESSNYYWHAWLLILLDKASRLMMEDT